MRATRVGNYVLLSVPRTAGGMLDGLTAAERQVTLAVLSGLSNAEVARMRGSSPRTIANQLATIFKKLGVHSRSELAARGRGDAPPRRAAPAR
ncbi:MAG TPA: helix-turn-helix transcriptional regulator [Kofleriaceae bacterium]